MKLDSWNRGYYFGLFMGASAMLYIHFDNPKSLQWFTTILYALICMAFWFAFKAVFQLVRHLWITRKIAKIQEEIARIEADIAETNKR